MNRLATEQSPYLRMHADNPIDWYPWCEEAFEAARAQEKPVFLSIGYSSCHWCHVLMHESFMDEGVAAILNKHYIAIKVDKEERPDIDQVYMDAVQLATGSGGWPMTILTMPSGEPFFAATYLPRESRDGMTGMKDMLIWANNLWVNERESVTQAAKALTAGMRDLTERPVTPVEPSETLVRRALRGYEQTYDREWGGFGKAPKFPSAHNLLFLLACHNRTGHENALAMVEGTLEHMARGGIFDQIGGGFCRYSVDRRWLIPHFEKMLYDNAMLLWAYAQAYVGTGNDFYRTIAEATAKYVLREMTGEDGAFYCAQDADSEGAEGAYYVFTPQEILSVLGTEDGAWFNSVYAITEKGNFEGKSVSNLLAGLPRAEDAPRLDRLRQRVYAYRRARMPLHRDEKVLIAWNALMIVGMVKAADALRAPEYLDAARRAEQAIAARCPALEQGVLNDWATYAFALTELYRTTDDTAYLRSAETIAERIHADFADPNGGYYLYSDKGEQLITRPKETWDGAMPSGNSMLALAFLRIAKYTKKDAWREIAHRQMRFVAGAANQAPSAYGFALLAISEALDEALMPA